MQTRHWVFTVNNWTVDNERQLEALGPSVSYLVYGYETAESGTPHLQGYLVFQRIKRFREAKTFLPTGAHLEAKRGSPKEAADYCKKGGLFKEFGELPASPGRPRVFEEFKDWVVSTAADKGRAPTEREIANSFPVMFLRYGRKMRELAMHLSPTPLIEGGILYPWQENLKEVLLADCTDDRSILFFVDAEGGKGKSFFQRWMLSKHPSDVQVLSVGKRDDVAHAIDESKRIFLFNVPRGGMEFFPYNCIEMLKDRVIFSPKYNSRTKVLQEVPHVVIFCNEDPDLTRMTPDRYLIENLDE